MHWWPFIHKSWEVQALTSDNARKRKRRRISDGANVPHAIKILEETGRELESEAGSRERVTGVGRDITDEKRWCCVFLVPLRSHRNNEVVNDTVYVTLHAHRLGRSAINNPLSIPISFGFLYNPEHRRDKKTKTFSCVQWRPERKQ